MVSVYVLEVTDSGVGYESKRVGAYAFKSEEDAINYLISKGYERYGCGYGYKEKDDCGYGSYIVIRESLKSVNLIIIKGIRLGVGGS